jgi:putative ABC transport system substrate-binding protein
MRRRETIAGIAGATLWPLAARAQQQKMPTLGVLVRAAPGWQRFWQLFSEAMRDLGYVEGRNIHYEFRSDEGDITRLPGLAAELVRLRVDVIVTWFTPAAVAAKEATREISIVCANCGDMIGTGLVASLARPGGNITGLSSFGGVLVAKNLELLLEIVPATRRVAVLLNAPDPYSKVFLEGNQLAARASGTAVDAVPINNLDELEVAFAAMENKRLDAVVVQPSLPTKRVAELALRYRIPTGCVRRDFVYDGGLMSYFAEDAEIYRRTASDVDKILKGAKPADLPVEQPSKFGLVINLKTAKALGLTVAPTLLARADEVIE